MQAPAIDVIDLKKTYVRRGRVFGGALWALYQE